MCAWDGEPSHAQQWLIIELCSQKVCHMAIKWEQEIITNDTVG